MEHAHDVKHSVEIALVAHGDGCPPKLLDKSLLVRPRRRGQPAHRGRCHHACGVARRERLAVQRVTIRKRTDALAYQKLLNAVAQASLARILAPPAIVHRPVASGAPRVVAEGDGTCPYGR